MTKEQAPGDGVDIRLQILAVTDRAVAAEALAAHLRAEVARLSAIVSQQPPVPVDTPDDRTIAAEAFVRHQAEALDVAQVRADLAYALAARALAQRAADVLREEYARAHDERTRMELELGRIKQSTTWRVGRAVVRPVVSLHKMWLARRG